MTAETGFFFLFFLGLYSLNWRESMMYMYCIFKERDKSKLSAGGGGRRLVGFFFNWGEKERPQTWE